MDKHGQKPCYPLIVWPIGCDYRYGCYFIDFKRLTPATADSIPEKSRLSAACNVSDPELCKEAHVAFPYEASWECDSLEEAEKMGKKLLALFLKECEEQGKPFPVPSSDKNVQEELQMQEDAEVKIICL